MEKAERDSYNLSTDNHKLRDKVEELQSQLERSHINRQGSTRKDKSPDSLQCTSILVFFFNNLIS